MIPAQELAPRADHGLLRFLTCGSVDDGKSTLIGRLLLDTRSVLADAVSAVERKGLLVPVTPLTPPRAGESVVQRRVRFRTVGDITCTCPVASTAATVNAIIAETATATVTERGATRMDDQTSDASMERRKKEGYF